MSKNPYGYFNDSTLAALQQAQNRYNNDPSIVALCQLQRTIEMTRVCLMVYMPRWQNIKELLRL